MGKGKLWETDIIKSPYFNERMIYIYKYDNSSKGVKINYDNYPKKYNIEELNKLVNEILSEYIDDIKPFTLKLEILYDRQAINTTNIKLDGRNIEVKHGIESKGLNFRLDIIEYTKAFYKVLDLDLFVFIANILYTIGIAKRYKTLLKFYSEDKIINHDTIDYYSVLDIKIDNNLNEKDLYELENSIESETFAQAYMYKHLPKYVDKCVLDKYRYMYKI